MIIFEDSQSIGLIFNGNGNGYGNGYGDGDGNGLGGGHHPYNDMNNGYFVDGCGHAYGYGQINGDGYGGYYSSNGKGKGC